MRNSINIKYVRIKKVKLIFFIIFGIGLNMNLKSQNYQSLFGSQSTSWDISFGACDVLLTQSGLAIGDTIINSKTYKKVVGFSKYKIGHLREDTLLGKAWIYNEMTNTEYLTMDLNLSVNDTFDVYSRFTPTKYVVDSVYTKNNLKHIRLNSMIRQCGSINENLTFIEGVGTNAGLFFQGSIYPHDSYMLCQHKNNVKTASSLLHPNTCFIEVIGIQENGINNNKIKVFPVPVSNLLTIKIDANTNKLYHTSIFNLEGKLVFKSLIKENSKDINVSELQNGIYFILIENKHENQVGYSKFIKK